MIGTILRGFKILLYVGVFVAIASGFVLGVLMLFPKTVIIGIAIVAGIIAIAYIVGRIAEIEDVGYF